MTTLTKEDVRGLLSCLISIWHDQSGYFVHEPQSARGVDAELETIAARLNDLVAQQAASVHEQAGADARDAARYRFLRTPDNAIVYAKRKEAWGFVGSPSGHVRYDTPEQLDHSIDRAMKGMSALVDDFRPYRKVSSPEWDANDNAVALGYSVSIASTDYGYHAVVRRGDSDDWEPITAAFADAEEARNAADGWFFRQAAEWCGVKL